MTLSTDTDSDGQFSDEAVKNHRTIISYFDENQRVPDIAWPWVQMGRVARFGYTLVYSETMTVTVSLKALSPSLQKDGKFTLEIRPEGGTMIRVERTIPAAIDPLMNLR
jgi:archaellin